MHHTLLTDKERARIHHEYRIRAAIVFCFLMSGAGLVGLVALFPAYIESVSYGATIPQTFSSDMKLSSQTIDMKNELARDKALASASKDFPYKTVLSGVLSDVIGVKGSNIFSSISLDRKPISDTTSSSSLVISIQGISPTRTTLLDLKSKLESLQKGNVVDLPITALTKSEAIPFSMKVIENMP